VEVVVVIAAKFDGCGDVVNDNDAHMHGG